MNKFKSWVDKKKNTELFLVIGTDKPTMPLNHSSLSKA